MSTAAKLERFDARISPEEKRFIERAAELSGRKLTDFVISAAHSAAVETIERYEAIALRDARDRETFVQAMINPPAPNAKLRAAAARYLKDR